MQSSFSGSYDQSSFPQIVMPQATRIFTPPWIQSVLDYQPVSAPARYPIVPPPTPDHIRAKHMNIPMPHTSSSTSTSTESNSAMTTVQEYKDQGNQSIYSSATQPNRPVGYNIARANNASSRFESKLKRHDVNQDSSHKTKNEDLGLARAMQALSVKEKKEALKAAEAISKITSPKRAAKAPRASKPEITRTPVDDSRKKKASASDASRRPRSSLGAQHRRVEFFGYRGGEIPSKGARTRKPLPRGADKDLVWMVLHRRERTAGAVPSSSPGDIVNPRKDDVMPMWAEGRRLGHSDHQGPSMATVGRYKSWNGLEYA